MKKGFATSGNIFVCLFQTQILLYTVGISKSVHDFNLFLKVVDFHPIFGKNPKGNR